MNFKNDWESADEVQAQKDVYKGIEFRSKLESKTAQALDNLGIEWVYEPDGYKLSNGMWYRPDFWLPRAHQFIECKGVMDAADSAKIMGLVEDTGYPTLVISYENAMFVTKFWNNPQEDVVIYTDYLALGQCHSCDAKFFYAGEDTYACPACGAYDGDCHFSMLEDVESGQALFNYGQSIASDKPIYKEIAEKFNR